MIINDLDGYYIVFDTKNWNTELDTLSNRFIWEWAKKRKDRCTEEKIIKIKPVGCCVSLTDFIDIFS